MDPAVTTELNKLDDNIAFRASHDHFHHTWARTFYSAPELYIQPQSVEEIEKVTTLARRCRRRITTVGSGHSPSDMTCTSSWMVNLDKFNKILSVDRDTGLVTMQAGIRLYQLGEELDKHGLAMPNLGSINEQSIAGAISTGTHGSTLLHSILSSSVTRLRITLSNSRTVTCSPEQNEELFRAALCSLGALGIITEITFLAVPAFSLHWQQTVYTHKHILDTWKSNLWTQSEFVRVWWYPYTRRATIWHASKTTRPSLDLPHRPAYFDSALGYHIYHNLLYLAQYVPRILPWVEWFISGMQFGFSTGPKTTVEAIQPSRKALLMDCLYSQTVNEWAIPLRNGPEALSRLTSWLHRLKPTDPEYVEHGIPYSAEGLWVHAPIEVRVSDTTLSLKNNNGTPRKSVRPHLDTSAKDGPTLYLNATLYRPYNVDPPCLARYYQGFEFLMRELDGKPHWAKNFETTNEELKHMYGDDLKSWLNVRHEADPEGMFVGPWHRQVVLGEDQPRLALEESEVDRKPMPAGGVEIFGELVPPTAQNKRDAGRESRNAVHENVSSHSSRSSFDFFHSGEAAESQHLPHSAISGDNGTGLTEAESATKSHEVIEDSSPVVAIIASSSSIASFQATYLNLGDKQPVTADYTTPDASVQEKTEELVPVSKESSSLVDLTTMEQLAATERHYSVDEPATAEESTAAKGPVAVEEPAIVEEPATVEQPAPVRDISIVEEIGMSHIEEARPHGETAATELVKDVEQSTTTKDVETELITPIQPVDVAVEAAQHKRNEQLIQSSEIKMKVAIPKSNDRPVLPLQSHPNGAPNKANPAAKSISEHHARKEPRTKIPTTTILNSKREVPDGSASTRASKRAKPAKTDIEELDTVAPVTGEQKENLPPPQARPNSLDELLEEQARMRGTEGGWRPQFRINA